MKVKYMAWQMLCLFLCAGVNAWAAPDTSSIPENASQVYASDVTTDSVQDNGTTSKNGIDGDAKDDNAPITPSEPGSEQKPEKPERELTEAELIDPENPQPVHTNTDDKSLTSKDNEEDSDAEAVYVDSQRYDGNKDKKTDLSVNTLSTDKEQAGEQTEDKSDDKAQTEQVKKSVAYVKSIDTSSTPTAVTTSAVQSTDSSVNSTQTATPKKTDESDSDSQTSTSKTSGSSSRSSTSTKSSTSSKSAGTTTKTTTSRGTTKSGNSVWAASDPKTTASSTSSVTYTSASTSASGTSKPLTPDGQGIVVDEVTDKDGKKFYTITTPDENVFYLVIDEERDSDNVYFLNDVTESDLMALAEKDGETTDTQEPPAEEQKPVCICPRKCKAGEVDDKCPICVLNLNDCEGIESKPVEESDLPQKPKSSPGILPLILLAALAAGGAVYYLKAYKPKHALDNAEDLDDLIGMEEEETVNEDEEPGYGEELSDGPEIPGNSSRGGDEPDEPDYSDRYEDEPDEPDYYEG